MVEVLLEVKPRGVRGVPGVQKVLEVLGVVLEMWVVLREAAAGDAKCAPGPGSRGCATCAAGDAEGKQSLASRAKGVRCAGGATGGAGDAA